ncbi:MAG: hypothetical protein HC866_00280 [Leptolyngbyaceae cyanobacterium RU_5_1]|nr:hypothetical protein [Leptolyngbyaceae cyanobacterium RU_5_1]
MPGIVSSRDSEMAAVQERFNLTDAIGDRFFTKGFENLPALTDADQTALAHLQQRFFEHRDRSSLP